MTVNGMSHSELRSVRVDIVHGRGSPEYSNRLRMKDEMGLQIFMKGYLAVAAMK